MKVYKIKIDQILTENYVKKRGIKYHFKVGGHFHIIQEYLVAVETDTDYTEDDVANLLINDLFLPGKLRLVSAEDTGKEMDEEEAQDNTDFILRES